MLTFKIQYYTHWGEELHLSIEGSDYLMNNDSHGNWFISIPALEIGKAVSYIYYVTENNCITRREWRAHTATIPLDGEVTFNDFWKDRPEAPFYSENFTRIVGANKVSHWRGAGVAIPVFSLRSKKSFGIGEFNDIPLMVDWAERTGMCIIQILPVNDTTMTRTWTDSYPYNANSTFALNPAYINLAAVGKLSDKEKMKEFQKLQKELNALLQIDYERVTSAKWDYLRQIYTEKGARTLSSTAYKTFYKENSYWLRPYAAFCYFRDLYKTPDFKLWKDVVYSAELLDSLDGNPEVALHYFIQYHLHVQLKKAAEYAHAHGITLKGDIPIGISRTSVDAWVYPNLFHMNGQAGAPPDAFATDGQNWGFPTYNWEEMAKDNYEWFRNRFKKMSDYFDAYRIDHLLGFFRIWEIPIRYRSGLLGHFNPAMPYSTGEICSRLGITIGQLNALSTIDVTHKPETDVLFVQDEYHEGYFHPRISGYDAACFATLNEWQKGAYRELHDEYFYHRHNDFWREEAMKKLPALIDSTDMLVCGEDLGMIPSCVPSVMEELHILSLEIQQMPKEVGVAFGHPNKYPYNSVCTTSTHDMSNLRAWWEEDAELTQRYWNEMLQRPGKAPATCETWIAEEIIRCHMVCPSMLAILPLQDWLGIDARLRHPDPFAERINIPANPRHYWRYRMHLFLEDLLKEDDFNDRVRNLATRG